MFTHLCLFYMLFLIIFLLWFLNLQSQCSWTNCFNVIWYFFSPKKKEKRWPSMSILYLFIFLFCGWVLWGWGGWLLKFLLLACLYLFWMLFHKFLVRVSKFTVSILLMSHLTAVCCSLFDLMKLKALIWLHWWLCMDGLQLSVCERASLF